MTDRPTRSQRYISFANNLSDLSGRLVSWLTVAMILITITLVGAHYFFNANSRIAQDAVLYMFGILFMVGVAYTLRHDNHVRVDIFYSKMSAHKRAWVDFLGTIIFLIPFCLVVFWLSLPLVLKSWAIAEGSKDAGIPALFILKSFVLVMPVLLVLQGIANALQALNIIRHGSTVKENS